MTTSVGAHFIGAHFAEARDRADLALGRVGGYQGKGRALRWFCKGLLAFCSRIWKGMGWRPTRGMDSGCGPQGSNGVVESGSGGGAS